MRAHRIRAKLGTATVIAVLVVGMTSCSGGGSGTATSAAPSVAASGNLAVVKDGLDAATTAKLNTAAEKAFGEISAPGAVVAISRPEGTWVATVGYQDWKKTVPMAADVHQRIGSVTKTFTVTALIQLAEEGSLSLDDPIEMYVPGMPNGDATLYQLATMRSGIPSYTFDTSFQDTIFAHPDTVWTPQQLVDLVKGQQPMYAPGAKTFYSNTNTVLLGMVIEKVAGKPIQDVVRERILQPLRLGDTAFPTDASFPTPHASGYTTQGSDDGTPVDATDWNPSWGWSAGAMTSNLDDLLVWGKVLYSGEGILSPEWQAQRLDSFDFTVPVFVSPTQDAPQSPARAYGLGLGLALGWYGHTGELPGFNTVVQHHNESGTTLVVMVNSDIKSGDCPVDSPVTPGGRTTGPCDDPAVHIANALADALGTPLVAAVK